MKMLLLALPVLACFFSAIAGCDGESMMVSQSSASVSAIDPDPDDIPITPPPPPPTLISEIIYLLTSQRLRNCIEDTGVKRISELTTLHCDFTSNSTRTIDLSILDHFHELRDLSLKGARIYDLNLEKLPKLEKLDISDTQIRSIDVSTNTQLKSLTLEHNELVFIDLSNHSQLTQLYLSSNRIGQLYLPVMAPLNTIDLSGNIIESNCSLLDPLKAQYPSALTTSTQCINPAPTPISDLDIENAGLMECIESTDAEFAEELTHLNCESDREQFSLLGIEQLYALESLTLNIEELANADLSGNPNIESITIAGDELHGLKISENTNLVDLNLASYKGSLTSYYDLTGNPELRALSLHAFEERPSSLDLSHNNQLETIEIYRTTFLELLPPHSNNLKEFTLIQGSAPSLDFSKAPNLNTLHLDTRSARVTEETTLQKVFYANGSALKKMLIPSTAFSASNLDALGELEELIIDGKTPQELDFSAMVKLKKIELSSTSGPIDFTNNTMMESIIIASAKDTSSINIDHNPRLQHLSVGISPAIDLSNNIALKSLSFYAPTFDQLDISSNIALESIDIYGATELSELNLSMNSKLTTADISYGNLASINLTNNHLLTSLEIPGNNIEHLDISHLSELTTLDIRLNPIPPSEICEIINQNPMLRISTHEQLQCENE